MWLRRLGTLALAAALVAGCAGWPIPFDFGRGDSLPATAGDGLHRVDASEVAAAYVRPGVRFSEYDGVLIDPVTLSYKQRPWVADSFHRRTGNYLLSIDATDRVRLSVERAFEREVGRSKRFWVASDAGPGVLRASGHIVNLVWEVPPPRGGETFYVRRTGEMTLFLDLRDTESGALLARIADRRPLRPEGAGLAGAYENSPVNNWAAVRDVSSRWGRVLRWAIELLDEEPLIPLPAAASARQHP